MGRLPELSQLSNFVRRFAKTKAIEGPISVARQHRLLQCWQTGKICANGGKYKYVRARLPLACPGPLPLGPLLPFPFTEDDLATPHIENTNSSDGTAWSNLRTRGLLPLGSTSVGTVLLLDDVLDFDECVR